MTEKSKFQKVIDAEESYHKALAVYERAKAAYEKVPSQENDEALKAAAKTATKAKDNHRLASLDFLSDYII